MKLFRNKNTEEMYISFTDSKDNLMDFNGNAITCSTEDCEEVNTKPKKEEFHRLHIVEESFDLREFCYKEWHLKDVLYVSVDNGYEKEDVAFRVEHISDDKVYFVAVDAVGESTLKNINSFLDDYLNKMPKDLVTMMCNNEHCFGDDVVRKSKLTLLSEKNVSRGKHNCKCNGADDIEFDGMKSEAEKCKNFQGKSVLYWLDTPEASLKNPDFRYFLAIQNNGCLTNCFADCTYAIVPCFSIQKSISLLKHFLLFH